jgi:hypothetical protein
MLVKKSEDRLSIFGARDQDWKKYIYKIQKKKISPASKASNKLANLI